MDTEMIAMQIIASAGDSKGYAFEALDAALLGDFTTAAKLIKQSDEASMGAHQAQTDMIAAEASGNKTPVDVLLVHSQDHLMTSMLANELIKEMIKMYQKINELEKRLEELSK